MTETPKIEPALTPEEWERILSDPQPNVLGRVPTLDERITVLLNDKIELDDPYCPVTALLDAPAVVAIANAALPNSDPRKITREKIADVVSIVNVFIADRFAAEDAAPALAFLDALESYLPPTEASPS